jgi:hypothetical protein
VKKKYRVNIERGINIGWTGKEKYSGVGVGKRDIVEQVKGRDISVDRRRKDM